MPEAETQFLSTPAPRPAVGDPAPQTSVLLSATGESFPLPRLWQTGPAILLFLRHLGCSFCRELIAQMREDVGLFCERGVTLGLINVAGPKATTLFCEERDLGLPFVCLSDPERAAFTAFGLSRVGPLELFTPHVVARGIQATLHGHFVGMPKGDLFQMPGVFIVDSGGSVRYAHRSRDMSDNPSNSELLAILDAPN